MGDNQISSVLVSFGAYLALYENDGFSGNPIEIDGAGQSNGYGGLVTCLNLDTLDFDDKASSLKVTNKKFGPAVGRWEFQESGTGLLELTLNHTTTSTHTQSTKKAMSNTITMEIKEGIFFESETLTGALTTSIE